MTIADFDPSLSARKVADFDDRSLVSLNRDIRKGKFPPPDYTIGQYRYWKLSTVIRAREERIAAAGNNKEALRATQLANAARARAGRDRARAETEPIERQLAAADEDFSNDTSNTNPTPSKRSHT